jgi:type VI secretion system secreted protein VgrG
MKVETPLGKDILLLQGFSGEEGVSRLFRFTLDLLSESPSVDFEKIVGKPVTVTLELADGSERYFHGNINRFSQGGRDERFTSYEAELVPWTWFLTQTADCRIFQKMKIPDIIEKIFTDLGFKDFKNHLQASYPEREYCVQYRETDFNFVSRLMEQYGIFYYFEHEQGKHSLVMADKASEHQSCPNQPKARYQKTAYPVLEEDVVTAWSVEQEVRPLKYALTDYNFKTPKTDLKVKVESVHKKLAPEKYEIYDYPGEYLDKSQGETLIKSRIEEEEAPRIVSTGGSFCRAFSPGYKFTLEEHYRSDLNKAYVLTSLNHQATEASYDTGIDESDFTYTNSFSCIPADVPFRPERTAAKPVVEGPQTALVVGKKGEEIWVDKYGRVKVQFYWDREGKKDENSSCWIRVSQAWAGKNWGFMAIPRIGQEVIVECLEGDPDQPVITGRVYNADQMPPYGLPANQTQTGIKSRSSKGGGTSNFNEFRFEDKKGNEEVYLHAEKNWTIMVENDKNQTVGHDETLDVKNNRTKTVGVDESYTIGKDRVKTVGNNESISVGVDRTRAVGSNEKIEVGSNQDLNVGNNQTVTVGKDMTTNAGMNMTLSAGVKLQLVGPGGMITIDASGVTIQGVLVKIN